MTRVRRILAIAAAISVVWTAFIPSNALADDPQTDPTCWPAAQCLSAGNRGSFDVQFELDPDCGGEWGRCYPGKKIDIQIHIPGLEGTQVRNLGQYLQVIYVWAVRIAAILAVVVIMVGGLLWLTSAGADRLGKAKELIGNAVIGLLIAVGSYLILQTINPDLVRLSLPRTMMLRPVFAGAKFCSGVPADVPIHDGGPDGAPVGESSRGSLPCGLVYHTPTAAAKMCLGHFCAPGNVCVSNAAGSGLECQAGTIGGVVTGDGEAFLDNDVELHVVCTDGSDHEILSADGAEIRDRRRDNFTFPNRRGVIQEIESACSGFSTTGGTAASSRIRGFTLWIEVNDDDLFGSGNDDWYAVGRESCGAGSAKPLTAVPSDEGDPSSIRWASLADNAFIPQLPVLAALRDQNPVSFRCDLILNRSDSLGSGFPDR